MNTPSPTWFSADKTFQIGQGWYVGNVDAINIGPYETRKEAKQSSKRISRRIESAKTDDSANVLILKFIKEEWKKVDETRSTTGTKSVAAVQPELSVRNEEAVKKWFRADRVYNTSSEWFFSTREEIQIGPFPTREDAETGVRNLIAILSNIDDPFVALLSIREFNSRWKA